MSTPVLVPLDRSTRSERALPVADALAGPRHATVVLLTAIADPSQRDEAEEHLELLALERPGPTEVVVVDGGMCPAKAIASYARSVGPFDLCLSTHGRSGLSEAMLGSVAHDVVAERPGPVFLVGPHCRTDDLRFTEVVVPTDGSSMADEIVPLAARWAVELGATIRLVTVVPPAASRDGEQIAWELADASESGHVAHLARQLEHEGVPATWDVLHDRHAAEGVLRTVGSIDHPLVVMATRGRASRHARLLGSTTAQVVHRAPCPVLALRPLTAGDG